MFKVPLTSKFFIDLFGRTFKMIKTSLEDFRFFALFLRYFSLFDMQMSAITSHMRNDLSKKFVYLFHSRTKSFRIEKFGVVGETRT